MFFRIYRSSALATIVSIIGACFLYGGIVCLFSGVVAAGLICAVAGVGIHIMADSMAENAVFKKWKKNLISNGYDRRIAQGDYALAVQAYNQNPGQKALAYMESLNAGVGSRLKAAIEASKKQNH